jgi:transcriptional regulator with XRE-family HTH domain
MEKTIHQGRNVKRFREMLGFKQEGLALELGDDWNQRKISLLEQKEEIEPELLEQIAKVLKVPSEAIKNFDEESAVNIIANTFHDEAAAYIQNYKCNFNPLDKYVESVEKNEKLYTALLKEKDEKIALLEKMLGEKKK